MSFTYIFIVGTAHQLFQVSYALDYFSIQKKNAVLLIEKLEFDKIDTIEINEKVNEIIFFKSWTFNDIFHNSDKINRFYSICNYLKNKYLKFYLFTSHYSTDSTLMFNSICIPDKFYLLDEGTASLNISLNRKKINYILGLKLFIKSILYSIKIFIPKQIIYFTRFNIQSTEQDLIVNYSIPIKNNKIKRSNGNRIFFLGSSIADIDLINKTEYLKLVYKVREYYKNKKFFYFAHRKESDKMLNAIKKLNIIIVRLEAPFEVFYGKLKYTPEVIATFYCSGVLDNLSRMFSELPFLEIHRFNQHLLKKDKRIFELIYNQYLMNEKIKIISI